MMFDHKAHNFHVYLNLLINSTALLSTRLLNLPGSQKLQRRIERLLHNTLCPVIKIVRKSYGGKRKLYFAM